MRLLLLTLSLIGLVGCGPEADIEDQKVDVEDQISALEMSGARIERDSYGKVTAVNLDNSQITDDGLEHLKGLTNLRSLDLSHTQVSDDGVAELKQSLPNCDIISEI